MSISNNNGKRKIAGKVVFDIGAGITLSVIIINLIGVIFGSIDDTKTSSEIVVVPCIVIGISVMVLYMIGIDYFAERNTERVTDND